ncbi:MAG: molybdopterin-dependent oxidoreductase [Chloroflexi bacterium]|nr:molybdopterin-dependent oxidoreductase [Chloroflexota bacterium]
MRVGHTSRLNLAIPVIVAGLLLILAAVLVYAHPWKPSAADEDAKWTLTLIGADGTQQTLTLDQIKAMTPYEGQGGFFTTAGVINGPYRVKGVRIQDLCELVGGIGPADTIFVSAADGYSSVFDNDEVGGNLPAYDPATLKEVSHEGLELILIYEQDGKALSHDDGKPVRLAVVGQEGLLTEGFYWVKWVNRIEVMSNG